MRMRFLNFLDKIGLGRQNSKRQNFNNRMKRKRPMRRFIDLTSPTLGLTDLAQEDNNPIHLMKRRSRKRSTIPLHPLQIGDPRGQTKEIRHTHNAMEIMKLLSERKQTTIFWVYPTLHHAKNLAKTWLPKSKKTSQPTLTTAVLLLKA